MTSRQGGAGSVDSHAKTEIPGDTLVSALARAARVSRAETAISEVEVSATASAGELPPPDAGFGGRYQTLEMLGEGGMGAVYLCVDRRVGREIALKVVQKGQATRSDLVARFHREARLQGQLEHPSIVPVYDIGTRPDGALFFTMKRVRGHALDRILDRLGDGDTTMVAQYGTRHLLATFARVCLAVAFAHARGVVHRDLKPANVMLGEYGEVYVLDWGVAKIPGADDASEAPAEPGTTSGRGLTSAGALLGTVGYMAPEQARGDLSVDTRADVYALGAILFEILTLTPMHPPGDADAAMASTLRAAPRPSVRTPDIAPELDELCARATALEPAERLGSARELHDAIERFLDGDRDESRRRALSEEHVRRAEEAVLAARGRADFGMDDRVRAMRELNAALAFDPRNQAALEAMVRLLAESPDDLPPEEKARRHEEQRAERARAAGRSGAVYLAILGVVLLLGAFAARSWMALGALCAVCAVTAGFAFYMGRSGRTEPAYVLTGLVLSSVVSGGLSVLLGPFVLVPSVAVGAALVVMVHSRAAPAVRWAIAAANLAAVLLPAALQAAGVMPQSYSFEGGTMMINPWGIELTTGLALGFLAVSSAMAVLIPTLLVGRSVDALTNAERRLAARAWYVAQLLPEEARKAGARDP
jgi:serine/threonine-protein kinase